MSLELLLWPPPVGVDPAALEGEKEEPVYTHSTKYHVIGASPDFLSVLPCFVEINSSSNERKAVFFESGAQTEPYAELTNGSRTKHDNQKIIIATTEAVSQKTHSDFGTDAIHESCGSPWAFATRRSRVFTPRLGGRTWIPTHSGLRPDRSRVLSTTRRSFTRKKGSCLLYCKLHDV